jgi:hypothetical protein
VGKQTIFISCGQFTEAEKRLGKEIAVMVKKLTGLEPFFAEEVQDLNGLDSNILNALRDCGAFITVLHPRGVITRPDKSVHVRASVWIEQEIAIATYIQRVEKRPFPIIAFKHESVGREGIRDLLHLNPIEFTDEKEVLAALPARLEKWKTLRAPQGVEIKLQSVNSHLQDGHVIRKVQIVLVNDTSERITGYDCEIRIPATLLKHWTATYPSEVKKGDPVWRYFRFNESSHGIVLPRETGVLSFFDYCTKCGRDASMQSPGQVASGIIEATIWINGREYSDSKTIHELAEDADRRSAY